MTHVEHEIHEAGSLVFVVTSKGNREVRRMAILGWVIDHSTPDPTALDQIFYKFPDGKEYRDYEVFSEPDAAFKWMEKA